jgi:hypothetical protein
MNTINELNLEFRKCNQDNNDWLWPTDDTVAWKYLNKKSAWGLPQRITKFCKK